jgi:hypothetical protein
MKNFNRVSYTVLGLLVATFIFGCSSKKDTVSDNAVTPSAMTANNTPPPTTVAQNTVPAPEKANLGKGSSGNSR